MKIKPTTVSYSNMLISVDTLKSSIKTQTLPIIENFNSRKVIGMTTHVWVENGQLMIKGHLFESQSLINRKFSSGIEGKKVVIEKKEKIRCCVLRFIGLVLGVGK